MVAVRLVAMVVEQNKTEQKERILRISASRGQVTEAIHQRKGRSIERRVRRRTKLNKCARRRDEARRARRRGGRG